MTQMIPLAIHDDAHFIIQAEDGTISLTWQHLTLHLQVEQFAIVARALRGYDMASQDTLTKPLIALVWVDHRMVQCWLARVGMNMCPHALCILLALIEQAYQVLGGETRTQHPVVPYVAFAPTMTLN